MKCCCRDVNLTFRLIPNVETKLVKQVPPVETVGLVLHGTDTCLENHLSVDMIHFQCLEIPPLFAGHERVLFLSSLKLDGMC